MLSHMLPAISVSFYSSLFFSLSLSESFFLFVGLLRPLSSPCYSIYLLLSLAPLFVCIYVRIYIYTFTHMYRVSFCSPCSSLCRSTSLSFSPVRMHIARSKYTYTHTKCAHINTYTRERERESACGCRPRARCTFCSLAAKAFEPFIRRARARTSERASRRNFMPFSAICFVTSFR